MKEVQQWSLGALGEVNRRGRRIRKKEIVSGCKYPLGIREFFIDWGGVCIALNILNLQHWKTDSLQVCPGFFMRS